MDDKKQVYRTFKRSLSSSPACMCFLKKVANNSCLRAGAQELCMCHTASFYPRNRSGKHSKVHVLRPEIKALEFCSLLPASNQAIYLANPPPA